MLAKHLPIADNPIRNLIREMYRAPEKLDKEIEKLVADLDLADFEPIAKDHGAPVVHEPEDEPAPEAGRRTPTFGIDVVAPRESSDFGDMPILGVKLLNSIRRCRMPNGWAAPSKHASKIQPSLQKRTHFSADTL